ncbi:MAG: hypothetical protein ACJ79R_13300 [Anaeromyxobacteraceae bacterium]
MTSTEVEDRPEWTLYAVGELACASLPELRSQLSIPAILHEVRTEGDAVVAGALFDTFCAVVLLDARDNRGRALARVLVPFLRNRTVFPVVVAFGIPSALEAEWPLERVALLATELRACVLRSAGPTPISMAEIAMLVVEPLHAPGLLCFDPEDARVVLAAPSAGLVHRWETHRSGVLAPLPDALGRDLRGPGVRSVLILVQVPEVDPLARIDDALRAIVGVVDTDADVIAAGTLPDDVDEGVAWIAVVRDPVR